MGKAVIQGSGGAGQGNLAQVVNGRLLVDAGGGGGVGSNVVVTNFPASQTVDDGGGSLTVDGTVDVGNFPAVYPVNDNGGSLTVDGSVDVGNFPASQTVDDGGLSLTVDGSVSVSNFPATQTVDGTVDIGNFPASQTVDDGGGSLTVDGSVSVSNFPAVYPVTDNGGSLTVDGSVSVSNLPASQTVDDGGGSLTVDVPTDVEVVQPTHDDLNANANLQVANTDVAAGNPVPVTPGTGAVFIVRDTSMDRTIFSGSTDGEPVSITATTSTGDLVHTVPTDMIDEVHLWIHAQDDPSSAQQGSSEITVNFGSTAAADQIVFTVSRGESVKVIDGWPLLEGATVRVYESGAVTTLDIVATGYVIRRDE